MKMYTKIFTIGLSLLVAMPLFASTISPVNSNTKITSYSGTQHLLIAPANTKGVSFNRFNSFNLDQDLNIVNLQRENSGGTTAKTIVISAPVIVLKSAIKIVGPKADLLSLASSSALYCQNCQIENVYRLSLAAASHGPLIAAQDVVAN